MSVVFARRKTLVCLVVALNLLAVDAVAIAASDPQPPPPLEQPPAPLRAQPPPSLQAQPPTPLAAPASHRPLPLIPLYVSLASLQALDAASTLEALRNGTGVEANPVMRGIVGSPAGFMAVKAGFTCLTILSSEKLWKKHRTAAIVMMVALNGGYAAVVAHNYSIGR